jgi:hypothetical protein
MTAWALLLVAVLAAGLWVAVHRCTRPWPARVPVRLEPSRPFLADADVKPDNPFIDATVGQGWRLYSVGPDQIDYGGRFSAFQPQTGAPRDQTDLCFHSDEFVPPVPAPTE